MNEETRAMKTGDILIVDPCYIKYVEDERYDALKCIKVLHDGDDGQFDIYYDGGKLCSLGVDSGRIWVLVAEFPTVVKVQSGFSRHKFLENKSGYDKAEQVARRLSCVYVEEE